MIFPRAVGSGKPDKFPHILTSAQKKLFKRAVKEFILGSESLSPIVFTLPNPPFPPIIPYQPPKKSNYERQPAYFGGELPGFRAELPELKTGLPVFRIPEFGLDSPEV
jgi:hypothetical protein